MQNKKALHFIVSDKESGKKLLAFLRDKCPEISVKAIKRAIDAGRCSVNGRLERFSTKSLRKGDRVQFHLIPEAKTQGTKAPVILFEDDDLLICDKPCGIVSDNPSFNKALPKYKGKLQLVHRLDKETSGVIILAKNEKMRLAMEELFATRAVHKIYIALVDGVLTQDTGAIDNLLIKKSTFEGQSLWGVTQSKAGKRAITKWKCVKRGDNHSLVELEPLTGRTHQLRVHLSSMGYPISGDSLYSGHAVTAERLMLHARSIAFQHPYTKKEVEVQSPLPSAFKL